jgi:hypothetical protein
VRGSSGTGRAQRRRCLPCVPPGGQRGEARRSVRSSALSSRRGARYGLAAQRCAGAVQRRRRISRCTDRSAGGCADWHTVSATRARACDSLDAAEALPWRCIAWRSRGRQWRGLLARATTRPCRLNAVQAGPLPAARTGVSGTPLGRAPRPPATALRQRLAAPARAARSGGDTHAPGLPPIGCPHGLGKRVRTDSRTAAIRGAWARCLLGKHREATRRARRLWRGSRRPCGGRGVVAHCDARSKRDGESSRTVR